jgi:Short chain fatty acid transporter
LERTLFPDPAVVAFLGVVVVFVLGVLAGEDPGRLAFEGGKGFWALVPYTMQMAMIIVGEHVCSGELQSWCQLMHCGSHRLPASFNLAASRNFRQSDSQDGLLYHNLKDTDRLPRSI